MAFKVTNRQILSKDVKRVDIFAPPIARKVQPGQFIICSVKPHDARLSLPVVETDAQRNTMAVIFQETDAGYAQLGQVQINDELHSVTGPFGNSPVIEKWGSVACVADGLGIAQILPLARALKQAGNKVISFIGAPTKSLLILQSQIRLASYKFFLSTQDGSFEKRGSAVEAVREFLKREKIDVAFAAGSPALMQTAAKLTQEHNVRTWAFLNPVMFDGTGNCGSCRVMVDGNVRLACVDGPVFDAHAVDFDDYQLRLNAYKEPLWDNLPLSASPKRSGSAIFGKFLLGIRKS